MSWDTQLGDTGKDRLIKNAFLQLDKWKQLNTNVIDNINNIHENKHRYHI